MAPFNPHRYGPVFAEWLDRPYAWDPPSGGKPAAPVTLTTEALFAHTSIADEAQALACVAAIHLHLGQWSEAHDLVQQAPTPEAHYWHGIAHRLEGDPGNASYWMHRAGPHPIHPPLVEEAASAGAMRPFDQWEVWQPDIFIDLWAESAGSGSDLEAACRQVHEAESRLLFDYCYRAAVGESADER